MVLEMPGIEPASPGLNPLTKIFFVSFPWVHVVTSPGREGLLFVFIFF